MPWCNKCGTGFGYDGKPLCHCNEVDLETSIRFRPGHNEDKLLKLIRDLENRVAKLEEK
jgi:hypothetical protein